MPELTIRKLHPVIGAEVTGINLAEPVDDGPARRCRRRCRSIWRWSSPART